MGVGKSKLIVDTIGCLYQTQRLRSVVIVGDKGNYRNWAKELPKHMDPSIPYEVLIFSADATVKGKKDVALGLNIRGLPGNDPKLRILLINVESLTTDWAQDHVPSFLASEVSMMVVDESTSIKTHNAARTKAAIKLGSHADYRRVMTGTPITQNPLDLYSQFLFLDPTILGHKSYYTFRNRYAKVVNVPMGPGRSFPRITGFQNLEELTALISPYCSRITKAECLDLPPKVYEEHQIEWTTEQRKAYDDMKTLCLMQLASGEIVSASSALVALMKLQQIACGWVYNEAKEMVPIPNNRYEGLMDVLEKVTGKAIIWCAFQAEVEAISAALGSEAVGYYGKTSGSDREAAIASFQMDPSVRFFVGTAATGGKGLTLTAANTVIYFSNTYNLEQRLQSEDRAHRIGQTKSVTYIDLVLPGSVDEKVLLALKNKEDLAGSVLDRLKELV